MSYILLAEDEATIGEMMRLTLEESGVEILHVQDGIEALAAIERRTPSLLLLDLLMPRLDGFGVLEHLKKKAYRFPVVILSNLSDDKSRKQCERLGVSHYIVKSNLEEETLVEMAKTFGKVE